MRRASPRKLKHGQNIKMRTENERAIEGRP